MQAIYTVFNEGFDGLISVFALSQQYIDGRFGVPGLIAAAIFLLSIAGITFYSLAKLIFNIVRLVVVPSLALTVISMLFLPYPPVMVLPAAVAVCSTFMILRVRA